MGRELDNATKEQNFFAELFFKKATACLTFFWARVGHRARLAPSWLHKHGLRGMGDEYPMRLDVILTQNHATCALYHPKRVK